jgi:hypothetical protein
MVVAEPPPGIGEIGRIEAHRAAPSGWRRVAGSGRGPGGGTWLRKASTISPARIEFLQPGGSTSSRAAATAVELQFAL